MRETLITTANMCMARFNATGDELFAHIAASVVILGHISYADLDPRVWPRDAYNKVTIGETDSATSGTAIGAFRIVKRTKELFKGYPYYVAIDLANKNKAWYLRTDGTISHECNDRGEKRDANSGWFASMEEVNAAIKLYEEKKGVKRAC